MKVFGLGIAFGLVALVLAALVWAYTPDESIETIAARYGVGPGDFRDIDGIRVHLVDSGPRDGPVVILLHGFGSSLETWDAFAAPLSTTFRVIRFDWPGFGLTGLDPATDYSDARSVAFLFAVMDALDIRRAALVGNSMGGKFAWMAAASRPERVSKLVLISPDGFASAGFDYGKAPEVPASIKLLPYVLPSALVRMSLRPAYADPARITDRLVERYRDFMRAPGTRAAMIERLRQVVLEPPEPRLRRIVAPTLILWGETDGMIPFSNAAGYVAAIPHARLIPLPGLGHVPHEESPDVSLPPVRAFLTDGP